MEYRPHDKDVQRMKRKPKARYKALIRLPADRLLNAAILNRYLQ
jgi:hypothetical protein